MSKWRDEMLGVLKTPLRVEYGCIVDADGNLVAEMNRGYKAVLLPVYRDELCEELVRRFNAFD